jgi:hypothetical protein
MQNVYIKQGQSNLQGHPQCLMNTITAGLPSSHGNSSLGHDGTSLPQMGVGASSTGGGGGVCHVCKDLGSVIEANGFAKGRPPFSLLSIFSPLGFFSDWNEMSFIDMPALRMASLVVRELNMISRCFRASGSGGE